MRNQVRPVDLMRIPTKLNRGFVQLWTTSLHTILMLTIRAQTEIPFLNQGNTPRNQRYCKFPGTILPNRPGEDNFHSILRPDVPEADFKSYKYPARRRIQDHLLCAVKSRFWVIRARLVNDDKVSSVNVRPSTSTVCSPKSGFRNANWLQPMRLETYGIPCTSNYVSIPPTQTPHSTSTKAYPILKELDSGFDRDRN